jgi:hypothetical protein
MNLERYTQDLEPLSDYDLLTDLEVPVDLEDPSAPLQIKVALDDFDYRAIFKLIASTPKERDKGNERFDLIFGDFKIDTSGTLIERVRRLVHIPQIKFGESDYKNLEEAVIHIVQGRPLLVCALPFTSYVDHLVLQRVVEQYIEPLNSGWFLDNLALLRHNRNLEITGLSLPELFNKVRELGLQSVATEFLSRELALSVTNLPNQLSYADANAAAENFLGSPGYVLSLFPEERRTKGGLIRAKRRVEKLLQLSPDVRALPIVFRSLTPLGFDIGVGKLVSYKEMSKFARIHFWHDRTMSKFTAADALMLEGIALGLNPKLHGVYREDSYGLSSF